MRGGSRHKENKEAHNPLREEIALTFFYEPATLPGGFQGGISFLIQFALSFLSFPDRL
jgi:hypothetical protein